MTTRVLNLAMITSLIVSLTFTSCSNNDDPPTNSQTQIENSVQIGLWRITYFNDSGQDETNHFDGYTFSFGTGGTLTATNGINTYNGIWRITDSNSNDDSQDDLEFYINFNLTNEFEDLNDDWHILSRTETKIELIDVSGGGSGTDYLTFEKN